MYYLRLCFTALEAIPSDEAKLKYLQNNLPNGCADIMSKWELESITHLFESQENKKKVTELLARCGLISTHSVGCDAIKFSTIKIDDKTGNTETISSEVSMPLTIPEPMVLWPKDHVMRGDPSPKITEIFDE